MPPACGPAPVQGCVRLTRGKLLAKEKKAGSEKLTLDLRHFAAPVTQAAFGDPVSGTTGYRLCLYDDTPTALVTLDVDRGGQACNDVPCWRRVRTSGYRYRDGQASADGVRRLVLEGGPAGKGSILLKGGNKSSKGQSELPTGTAAALAGTTRVTARLVARDAGCFEATLATVKKADGMVFKVVGR